MIPDPAFGRAEDGVVVDAVADEDLGPPVVHDRRHAHDEGPARIPEPLVDSRVQTQALRGAIQLLDGRSIEGG